MAEPDEDIEQTLHIARAVSVFRIPPRPGVAGWRSGEWLVSDKLFSGRMRMVAKGERCEIRLEDPSSGELFAVCPVAFGQRNVCVEPVTDSSRYYVLRVEDPQTHRHAFLGMGFDNRSDAFDFNEALVRHEQQVARERAARAKAAGSAASSSSPSAPGAPASQPQSPGQPQSPPQPQSQPRAGRTGLPTASASASAANSSAAAEVEGLYRHTAGLRLEEGQTIRVNVSGLKRPGGAAAGGGGGGGGFLSNAAATLAPPPAAGVATLPPPPVTILPPPQPSNNPHTACSPVTTSLQGNTTASQGVPQPLWQPTTESNAQPSLLDMGKDAASASKGLQSSGADDWARFD